MQGVSDFKKPVLIKSQNNLNNSLLNLKGDKELKNIRKRNDGRWEWRKTIDGKRYSIINKNQKKLLELIRTFKPKKEKKENQKKIFIDLAWEWFNTYKKDKIKSEKSYKYNINNHFNVTLFKKDINKITLQELQNFLNNIKGHRTAKYSYFIIKGVYFSALKNDLIKKDISQFLDIPKNKTIKGSALTLNEQILILENLDNSKIKNEILFYLLTGARRSEGVFTKYENINFDKNMIFINGTKTNFSKRYVPISENFKTILKENFNNMFSKHEDYYTKAFKDYTRQLNIKNKTLHDLRHTFSTNLYYLNVKDKLRQYYMGHASIVMTNDIYTTLDPTISKEDILKIYKDLYPNFEK